MALTDVSVSLFFKRMVVPYNSGPQCLLGMWCIMKGLTLDHMGAPGKGKNVDFRYEVLFPFSYTFKSGEKYDAILHNGSGQPAPALKLVCYLG